MLAENLVFKFYTVKYFWPVSLSTEWNGFFLLPGVSVTIPTWVDKTCLCFQYLTAELKQMYSEFTFDRCTFHVHGKSRSGSLHVFLERII